jgi:hypothetical protein
MFDPATQHCSHGCVEQAVAEKADPLRTMVAELPESQARFRMHEPDANEIDSVSCANIISGFLSSS